MLFLYFIYSICIIIIISFHHLAPKFDKMLQLNGKLLKTLFLGQPMQLPTTIPVLLMPNNTELTQILYIMFFPYVFYTANQVHSPYEKPVPYVVPSTHRLWAVHVHSGL